MVKERVKPTGLALFLFVLAVSGCASRGENAASIAAARGWVPRTIATQTFDLATWGPAAFTPGAPLIVYFEGDGLAFLSATRISDDPTPRVPLALQLATRDPRPNVVYVARPCQFVTGPQRRNCSHFYWTNGRYAEPAVAAMDAAVERFKAESGAASLRLYGYSGGGAMAALLAARRDDVTFFATVSGVLDHETWTRLDGMTPLSYSLNPAAFHQRLATIRQIHYVGAADDVVPPSVAAAYQARFAPDRKPPVVIVKGADHECCWAAQWPSLLSKE